MKYYLWALLISISCFPVFAKVVRYELNVTREKVNLSGKKPVDFALLVNHSIPAPTLEFTEGDEAEIVLKNDSDEDEISVHWHGILLDPYMDGVPYVNTPPIYPGKSYTFKFKLRQHGTYWYHSHTNVQEQKGVYGAIIIHPKERKIKYDRDIVAVLSDWSDENPTQILKNLRKDGEYYLYKKRTIRSLWGAYKAKSLGNYFYNEMTRMGGMDYSDVGYDAFLINGKNSSEISDLRPGEKVRIRIINAAASSYFYVSMGKDPMNVISADGVDIKPALAEEILIGMAETYDLLYEVPKDKSFELKATSQDGTGEGSIWIGQGEKVSASIKPKPDLYAKMYMGGFWDNLKYTGSFTKPVMSGMDHSQMGHMDHEMDSAGTTEIDKSTMDHSKMSHSQMDDSTMDHSTMDQSKLDQSKLDQSKLDQSKMDHSKMDNESSDIIKTLTVDKIESEEPTNFSKSLLKHDVKFVLDGDMERYIWLINGKAISEDRTISINENEVVRFTFVNNSMMHHPMHLHGHFFRVITKKGEKSPMKHTVDVPPHSSRTIEFYSNEPGEWMLHCHNLYHLKTGMARVVKYSSFTPKKEIQHWQKHDPHMHDHTYYTGRLEAATNHAQGELFLRKTWDEIELRAETREDFNWEGEGDLFYKRWLNKYTHLIAGGTLVDREAAGVVGFGYILPFLLDTHTIIDHKGRIRLNLEKRFQWTEYIYTDAEFTFRQKQDSEFEVSLMYQKQWDWSAGLMFTEHSAGLGFEYKF
jgi:CopA family copper-resistance protein